MSRAAKSVLVFGIYLTILGAIFVVAPNLLLKTFGMPTTKEVWIRVMGMVVFLLSLYYITAARQELTSIMRLSVYLRATVILFFMAFVMAGIAKPILILFGAIDLAGAAWTDQAFRLDKKHARSTAEAEDKDKDEE